MSFMEHLGELRTRLARVAIVILSLAVVNFIFITPIFNHIILGPKNVDFISYQIFNKIGFWFGAQNPMFDDDLDFTLQSVKMTGQFASHVSVSLMGALMIAFPFVILQLWGFLKPGLKDKERKGAKNAVFYSSLLMIIGSCFGYFVVAPLSVHFFGKYQISEAIQNQFYLASYISMVVKSTFYSGLLFQLPILAYIFTRIGLIDHELMIKYRKHAIVGILILAAIITPPDFITQIIVGVPVFLLYELGIVIAKVVNKKRVLEDE